MKSIRTRLTALIMLFVLGIPNTYANLVELNIGIYDPTALPIGHGKGPVSVPVVTLDDHELAFQALHAAFTLYIMDGDVAVYSVAVSSSATSVILPPWLSGDYELQLRPDNSYYYFYGDIEFK